MLLPASEIHAMLQITYNPLLKNINQAPFSLLTFDIPVATFCGSSMLDGYQRPPFASTNYQPTLLIHVIHPLNVFSCAILTRMSSSGQPKKSVDEIWKQLNAKTARPQSNKNFDKLWFGFTSDVSNNKAGPVTSSPHQGLNPLTGLLKSKAPPANARTDASNAAQPKAVENAPAMSMERCVQSLQGTETALRKTALLTIQKAAKDPAHEHRAEFEELADGQIGKALLRRFDDPSEVCRELAVGTLR